MPKGDFYLAAAALIPLLRLVDLAGQGGRVVINFRSVDAARRVHKLGQPAIRFSPLLWLGWWGFYGWTEWICLRSLETGRSAAGGTTVVWIALAFLGIQAAGTGFKFVPAVQGIVAPDTED